MTTRPRSAAVTLPPVRPELARRVLWEADAVADRFPCRFRLVLTESALLAWDGAVPVEGGDFPVRVV